MLQSFTYTRCLFIVNVYNTHLEVISWQRHITQTICLWSSALTCDKRWYMMILWKVSEYIFNECKHSIHLYYPYEYFRQIAPIVRSIAPKGGTLLVVKGITMCSKPTKLLMNLVNYHRLRYVTRDHEKVCRHVLTTMRSYFSRVLH